MTPRTITLFLYDWQSGGLCTFQNVAKIADMGENTSIWLISHPSEIPMVNGKKDMWELHNFVLVMLGEGDNIQKVLAYKETKWVYRVLGH